MSKRDWRRATRYEPEAPPERYPLPVPFLAAQYRPRKRKAVPKPSTYSGPRLPEKVAALCDWLEEV